MMNQDAAASEARRLAGPRHPYGSGYLNPEGPHAGPHAHLVPAPATITDLQAIGADPATGEPLQVALWSPLSGAMTIAVTGDGQAVGSVVNSIAERVTACDDAALLCVTRHAPDGAGWDAVADAAGWDAVADAAGHAGEGGRALLVLQFASLVIHERAASGRQALEHVPTNAEPLWVLLIEDAGALAADSEALALLAQICKAGRTEGVAVVIAGRQLPAEARANIDRTLDAAQLAGKAFAWQDRAVAKVAASRAVRLPRQLEPALASLQPLLGAAAGKAPDPWAGDAGARDGRADDPRLATAAGSWHAVQAELAACEVERILGGKCDGPGGRMAGHGLIAVTYALLSLFEALTAAGNDTAVELATTGEALADITSAIDGLADDARRPRRPRLPRRRRRAPGIEYTQPEVFTQGLIDGWADWQKHPADVDWGPRLASALVPYAIDHGRPVSPWAPTGIRYGRNGLGKWGENPMADMIATCRHRGQRHLLLVERRDGGGWAVPGGSIEDGEDGLTAAIRELKEETSLVVSPEIARAGMARHVPDPRASDEAWAVTVPCAADLGDVDIMPAVQGADDARRAAWLPASDYDHLVASIAIRYAGAASATVFAAHQQMLRAFLGGLPAAGHDDAPPVVAHTVGWWRDLLDRAGVAVPRALCGQLQAAVPGQPLPGPGSPQCPACAARVALRGKS
jgi:ADP-ribose pyrophosphatase